MRFANLGLTDPDLRAELDRAWARVADSGWTILGPELEAFEREFAAFCGVGRAVGVANGLDALTLALRAKGVGAGDEVIVPAFTFAATWLAVRQAGATPRPIDVDPATFTISAEKIEEAITPRTAAVIPVSLYGHPVDMDPIMDLAARRGLFVLGDAAQSHGALYKGRRTGGLAHATAFSFYPTKNLGALGDGGAVTTDDPALAERLGLLRNYGSRRKYLHEVAGVNSRLDELQAAFLRVRLLRLPASNDARRGVARIYEATLREVNGLVLPQEMPWAHHVYHLYVVRSRRRDALQAELAARGIETLIHYPIPCHRQPAFADLGFAPGDFPVAEQLGDEVLSLPMWPGMATDDAVATARAVAELA